MNDFELDLFNIETLLIESNSMESLETSLNELIEMFSLSEDVVEMVKIIIYKQYYIGRLDSNKRFISAMRAFADKIGDLSDDHVEVIKEVIATSDKQMK